MPSSVLCLRLDGIGAKMIRIGLLALCALAALGCRPRVDVRLAEDGATLPVEERWPDAKAVILLSDFQLIDVVSHDTSYSERRHHRRILLRSRDALDLADLRINIDEAEEIVDFQARSVAKDGTVRTMGDEILREAKVKKDGEDKARVYVAAIEGAEVGGTIEYTYAIFDDYPVPRWEHDLAHVTSIANLPIVDARFEVSVNTFIKYAVRASNTREKFQVVKDGNMTHLRWRDRDIGTPPPEKWAPSDDAFPRLVFAPKAYATKTWRRKLAQSWDSALRYRTRWFNGTTGDLFEGYAPPALPDCAAGPGRTMCLIEGALDVTHEKAPFDNLSTRLRYVQDLRTVLAEQAGNQMEKAVLCGKLLQDAGVEVRYAPAVRPFTRRVKLKHPSPRDPNHLLLWLPPQAGLDEGLWLEPACEHCRPGELSGWAQGARAFVMTLKKRTADSDEVTARPTTARGKDAVPERLTYAYAVELASDGTAEVLLTETYEGLHAVWFGRHERRRSTDERQEAVERRLARIDDRARLVKAPKPECDLRAGRCTRTLEFTVPGYATPDGDELLVPLTLFKGHGKHKGLGKTRTRDMLLSTDAEFIETLDLKLPAGFGFVEGPEPYEAASDAFTTALAVQPGAESVAVSVRSARKRGRYAPDGNGPRYTALRKASKAREGQLRLRRQDATAAAAP